MVARRSGRGLARRCGVHSDTRLLAHTRTSSPPSPLHIHTQTMKHREALAALAGWISLEWAGNIKLHPSGGLVMYKTEFPRSLDLRHSKKRLTIKKIKPSKRFPKLIWNRFYDSNIAKLHEKCGKDTKNGWKSRNRIKSWSQKFDTTEKQNTKANKASIRHIQRATNALFKAETRKTEQIHILILFCLGRFHHQHWRTFSQQEDTQGKWSVHAVTLHPNMSIAKFDPCKQKQHQIISNGGLRDFPNVKTTYPVGSETWHKAQNRE